MEYQKEYIEGEKLLAPFRELSTIEISLLSIGDIMDLPAGSSYDTFQARASEVEEILEKLTSESGNIEDRELIQKLSQKFHLIRAQIEDDYDWEKMQERIRISPEIMDLAKQAMLDDPLSRLGFSLEDEPIALEQVSERQFSSYLKTTGFQVREDIPLTEEEDNALSELEERFRAALSMVKSNPNRYLVLHNTDLPRMCFNLNYYNDIKPDSASYVRDPFLHLFLLGVSNIYWGRNDAVKLTDLSQTSFDTVVRSYTGLKNYFSKMQPSKHYSNDGDNALRNLEMVFESINSPEKLENYLANSPDRILISLNKPLGSYTESAVPEETPHGLLHRLGKSPCDRMDSSSLAKDANFLIDILDTSMATVALGEEKKSEMLAAIREAKDILGNADALKDYLLRSWREEERRKRVEADREYQVRFEETLAELRKRGRLLGPELYENLGIRLKGINTEIPSNINIFKLLESQDQSSILVFDSGYSLDSLCRASQRSNGLKIKTKYDKGYNHDAQAIKIGTPGWQIIRPYDLFKFHLNYYSRLEDVRKSLVALLLQSFADTNLRDLSEFIRRDSGFSFNRRRRELTCDFTKSPPPVKASTVERRSYGEHPSGGPHGGIRD